MRLSPPMPAPDFSVRRMDGSPVTLASFRGRPLWLVLSRYAACPFCSLRVDLLVRRHPEVAEAGVSLLVIFPSPVERIERYVSKYEPPFGVGADPEETVFEAYGSEASWAGEARTAVNLPKVMRALAHAPNNPFAVDGPIHRMPAEFLIDSEGTLVRAYYGRTLDDGLPVDDVIAWGRGGTTDA